MRLWAVICILFPHCNCPCCGGNFPKFLPYGTKKRENAQCPKCGCLERHRLLWLYLKNKTNFFKNNIEVLHIAPNRSLQKRFEGLKNISYISGDISGGYVALKIDITDIKLSDNRFDFIICYHVLEHIPEDLKAMRELFRVLKPGGKAIIQSPIGQNRSVTFENKNIVSEEEKKIIFGHKDHVRIYGDDFRTRLESAGFIVKIDEYARQLGERLAKKHGLMLHEKIYLCTKSHN